MASEEDEKKMELEHVTSLSRRDHERPNPFFRVRAVSLGGWLVTEGWIKPSLFDGIPNKDLLVSKSYKWLHYNIIIIMHVNLIIYIYI